MATKNQTHRLPPQSIEAEQAVLGCMLIDPDAVPKVFHSLTENSFFKLAHLHIYRAMSDLFEKNETIDSITVSDQLKKSGKLSGKTLRKVKKHRFFRIFRTNLSVPNRKRRIL